MSAAAAVAWFNWVDHASPGMANDNIHILNPGAAGASGYVEVTGVWSAPFNVSAAGETYVPVPVGVIGGPAKVVVTTGPPVISSQRVQYFDTFNEVPAASSANAIPVGWFSWYDRASPGMTNDNIHVVNPGASPATGVFTLAGGNQLGFSVPAGQERYYAYPWGTIDGPLRYEVTSGPGVIVSQRVQYGRSFNEILAQDPARASTTLFFNWFDQVSAGVAVDNVHIVNPGLAEARGSVSGPGLGAQSFTIPAGRQQYLSWRSLGGPVRIDVTAGRVLASQRLSWWPTFTEWPARSPAEASSDTWFNWYDRASPGFADDIHVTNPGATASTVSVALPGQTAVTMNIPAGANSYYSYPRGTLGGPLRVRVTSGPAVLVSQRAFIFNQSPNRILAVPLYHQRYALSCEEAALRMALAYEGIDVSEEQIFSTLGIDYRQPYYDALGFRWGDPYAQFVGDPNGSEINHTGYGSYHEAIARTAGQLGGHPIASGERVSPATIYQGVVDGHPAVAWVSFDWASHRNSTYIAFDGRPVQFGAPYEHAVVVVGVNDDQLLINNPWSGQQWVSKAAFETAYEVFNEMAVILQ
ncbi:MAG: C39 family peptidase [Chloroflexota bacterium]